jgi:PAS domain S-box-containing protein
LTIGLVLSSWIFLSLRREGARADAAHFDLLVQEAQNDISQRMTVYENALRGGQALCNVVPEITRNRWKVFVDTMDLANRFPGIRGMGVVFEVAPENLATFIADVRLDGRPSFALKGFLNEAEPVKSNLDEPLYIITYREPEIPGDVNVIGVNIAEEPNRRKAMEEARDTGTTVVTNRLFLTIDKARRPAFVLYAPVYRPGLPITSVEQRREAFRGWIYASFVAEDLIGKIMGTAEKEVTLSFYQGVDPTSENLLYVSTRARVAQPTFERLHTLQLAGRTFTFGWNRGEHFSASGGLAPIWAGASSTVLSSFLALFVSSLLASRRRVLEALARQDVELAYQKFALDQHAIVAITDARGKITYANDKFCAISGYTREELIGQNHRMIKSGFHPPEFFQQLYATVTAGKVWHGDVCNRNKNGTLNWMAATIVPFLGPDGRPEKYVAIRSDITALKEAQEHIRHSQERLASIFNALDEGVLLQERTTHILESNASAERILGLSRSQIAGDAPMPAWWQMVDEKGQIVAPENSPTVITFRTGRSLRGIIRGLKKQNGSTTWISVNNEPIRDGSGAVHAVVSSFVDITEQRWAENALKEASQRMHLAAAIAKIGIWDWDLGSNRILADARMFEIYGLPPTPDGCFPSEIWREVVVPEDLPTQMAHLSQTLDSGGRSWRQFRIRRKNDGAIRYIESEDLVQTDETGKAVRIVGVNRDITDTVTAETALLESEARTRLFAEHAPASVAMFDREMRYLVVSNQWMTDNKLGVKSIIGRCHYDVFPDTTERWKEIHRRCLGGAVETCLSDSIKQQNGSVQWLQWEVRPWYMPNGEIGGIVMFTLDITQRCELETRLEKARDDALAASRLKSEFLATMSHEIRTPMNGVIGMASLLLQTPLEGQQRDMAQALVNSAERLLVIINDILDFSKIEAGKLRIEPMAINLRDVIEETAALMAAPAHKKHLRFTCDIDPALATGFSGDSGRIQQVLANLLGNAVKFTHQGEIALSTKVLNATEAEISFCISVTDTGIGIPASAKEWLFQPFMQADGSTTRRFGGTGLGLAICSQLVALMGGRIGFESTVGVGSTFWIELCLPRITLPTIVVSDKIPPEARVLVVDSHGGNRQVLLRQLAQLRVASEAVGSAAEALDLLVREAGGPRPFGIVLLDWSMPLMNGLAIASAIRSNPAIASTRLIILSSTSDIIDPGVAARLKFHGVLATPVRDVQLQRCLLSAYGRRATPTPFSSRQALAGRGLKLLLAEDNETNQLVARLMLEQLGHSIEIAETGNAVLEWLATEPFDAVLMDCQMPGMDGYEATRRIRAGKVQGANPSIPIIALTAYAMPADRNRVLEAGMDDYVSKPLSKNSLHAALARCGLVEVGVKCAVDVHVPPAESEVVRIFDPKQREKLRAISRPDGSTVWDKALSVFLKEMPARLAALSAHVKNQQADYLSAVAHTIAGSAASIGAPALRAAGLALERAAGENDENGIATHQAALEEAWRLLQNELTKIDNL